MTRSARSAASRAARSSIGAFASTVTLGQGDKWYPSRWGAADQRGAANRITPAKVLDAKAMITKGTVYQLGRVYEAGMPLFGSRHYSLKVPYAFPMPGKNQASYHDDIISGELSQIGTQFDGLGHVGIGELFYNGNRKSDFAAADGLKKLGVENVGAIVTRGVLIDVAKFKGVPRLQAPYAITVADLTGALQRQKVDIRPGDVVLIHTGWGSLWMKDNATFGASSPGIGVAAGEWLAEQRSGRGGCRQLGRGGLPESRCRTCRRRSTSCCWRGTGSTSTRTSRPRGWRATMSTSSPTSSRRCGSRARRARRAIRSRSADHEGR